MRFTFSSPLISSFIIIITSLLLTVINGIPILYKGNEPGLIILSSSNFSQFIYHQRNTFIVEFFNSWCGHCVRFAPTWKAFAKDVRHWSKLVKIVAIDCAEESNVKLCSDYNINLFPSLRYFWHNYDYEANGQPLTTQIGSIDSMRHDYLDWVHRSWSQGAPNHWPNLNYLDPSNPDEWSNLTSTLTSKDLLILVEGEKSYLGREVILDLSPFLDTIVVRRIKTGHKWLEQLNETPLLLPVVIKISKGGKPVIFKRPDELGPDHRRVIVDTLMSEYNLTYSEPLVPSEPSFSFKALQETSKHRHSDSSDALHMADLYLSIHETLYKQIPLHRQLNSTNLETLKNFIQIVNDYFPFDYEPARSFISSLSKWLSTQVHILDREDFLAVLDKLNHQTPFPKPDHWITCAGSEPGFRGYPCSLWLLFHTLTVNEYMKTSGELEEHKVLYTMRDYISKFFSCEECAKHFVQMSAGLDSRLIYPNSSVIWLWKAHNIVNRRLSKDLTEDPVYPKIQFPSPVTCPTCWTSDGHRFNDSGTFIFLITRYRGDNLVKYLPTSPIETRTNLNQENHINSVDDSSRIQFHSFDHDFQHSGNMWTWPNVILNRMDISLCLFLYIITSCMLLTFCFILSFRKRRRKDHKFKYPMAP